MQFGIFGGAVARLLIPDERQVYSSIADYVCEAEELGFKSFFIAEHHFSGISQISAVLNVLSYLAARTITVEFYGQSAGTYDHYFNLFLPPIDVLWSFGKVLVFAVVIIMTHCYYGYRASGGPAGVGVAVGRAVRTAIVTTALLDFFLSLAIWGATTTVRIAG